MSSLASGTITPPFGLCSAGHARTPVSSQRPPSADVRMTPAATHAGVVPFGEIGHARGARTSARFGSGPILGAACFVSRSYEHCGRVIRRSERASATKSIRSLCRWLSRGRSARPARRVADWGMPSARNPHGQHDLDLPDLAWISRRSLQSFRLASRQNRSRAAASSVRSSSMAASRATISS